ncbi:hypothetical protein FRB96_000320 [Tulasnella sp. 330]|nr:hypothetical protein FRB96_000320 [Tulasnella sp. 330]KAG8877618.1 hypothetical protein FRB97_003247 [Tulasnella sp. 331]KAG8890878.1 hypothetical protein FRB98_002896 [Tulasnella sp. 332]
MLSSSLLALLSVAVSSVSAAPHTSRSKGKTYTGHICGFVAGPNGSKISGHVASQLSSSGQDASKGALDVEFTVPSPGDFFSIQSMHGHNSMPYLAFIDGPGDANNGNLAGGAFSYVYLGASLKTTPAGSHPVKNPNSATPPKSDALKGSETSLWVYNDGALVPHWVNEGSQDRQRVVFYDLTNKFFGITGDLAQQQKFSPQSYPAVYLPNAIEARVSSYQNSQQFTP